MLLSLGAVVVFVVAVGSFLMGTAAGARWTIGLVLERAPLEISIEQIEGRLMGRLRLRGVRAVVPAAAVDVGLVELDWAPGELVRRRLHVERLVVDDVTVRMLTATPDSVPSAASPPLESVPPPDLPLEIVIDEARISRAHMVFPENLELTDVRVALQGRPEDYSIEMAARMTGDAVPEAAVDLEARGDLSSIAVERLIVRTLEGKIAATAQAAWYPGISWRAQARADSLALDALAPQLNQVPARLGAVIRTEGRLVAGEPVGWAVLDTLTGHLRGHPARGHGRVDFDGSRNAVVDLDLVWATITARVAATVDDTVAVDAQLACDDLAPVMPHATGSITADIRAHGLPAALRATATIRADSLDLPAAKTAAAQVEASAHVDLADGGSSRVEARIFDLVAGTTAIDTTVLVAEDTDRDQRLRLTVAGPWVRGLVALAGRFDPDARAWSGTIDTLEVANREFGAWHLQQPASLAVGTQAAALDSFRFANGAAALALDGAWDPAAWSVRGFAEQIPLDLVQQYLPPDRTVHGTAEARFRAQGTAAGDLTGELVAGLDDARLVLAATDSLLFEDASLRVAMGDSGVAADLELVVVSAPTGARVDLAGELSLPGYANLRTDLPAQPLIASLRGDLPDLAVFEGLDPRATHLGGGVTLAVDASGTLGDPVVKGEVRAEDMAVSLPDLGITVEDGRFVAQGDPVGGFTLTGGAHSGDGEISIEGHLPPAPSAENPARVAIIGDRFRGMGTPEIEVLVSPDLALTYNGERIDVTGLVNLPVVRVELVELPESAVPVSRDVIILEEGAEPVPPPVDTWIDVQVVLGDEVVFSGNAMSIALEGAVNVRQHPPNPPEVLGDIRIREGYYRAYGQNLTIDRGTISFVGPVENPNLDMRAYREAFDGTIAGLRITGSAEQPNPRIYSEPAMSDANAISYLLTGRPLDAGSGDDKARVADTAALMSGNVLSSYLGSRIGLDEARIETGGTMQEAALVTGKYLTPNLYLSYAMGLFDRSNLVRLRFILSPDWAVQTETGTAQGADVFYRIESGGD
ncbi:MAG: hypothetical protein GY838_00375 [bacterium]|nr:hypothetical protein [bacterium]